MNDNTTPAATAIYELVVVYPAPNPGDVASATFSVDSLDDLRRLQRNPPTNLNEATAIFYTPYDSDQLPVPAQLARRLKKQLREAS